MPSKPQRKRSSRAALTRKRTPASPRSTIELRTLQAFRTIFGTARKFDADVRRTTGVSGSQLWALSEIARASAMSVNDLAATMALHQTTASNLINALVERKLIRRLRDSADQRVARLHVTTEGKRMLLRAPGPYPGLLVDALRKMKEPDLGNLRKALQVLTAMLRDAATDAAGETLMGE